MSQFIAQRALALGARAESIPDVVPTGVSVAEVTPTPLPDEPTVLHVARLVEKKGTEYLIRALPSLKKLVPEVKLRIVGQGPLRAQLEGLADSLGVGDIVEFLGARKHGQVLDEIANSRVLCLPSVTSRSGDAEGLGQVLLEAGALARPVVKSLSGGIVDCNR